MSNNLKIDEKCRDALDARACAVGVSGGSDSLALLHLLRAQTDANLTVLSVDHGLRAEARDEAEYVAAHCARLNIRHEILPVDVAKSGNLAANARVARYDAMTQYCLAHDISYLAIGHTLDDQIETYFMNGFRGSGVDGLAAMPAIKAGEPAILRPMLGLRRADLQAYLADLNVDYVSDPSNEDRRYDRVRLRQYLREGESLGFAFDNLASTTRNLQRASDYLQSQSQARLDALVEFAPLQIEARFERAALLAEHAEIALRMLAQLCQFYGGSPYKPRLNALERLLAQLEREAGGMVLEKTEFHWGQKWVKIYAECGHLPKRVAGRQWSRFVYEGDARGDEMGALMDEAHGFDFWREWGISAKAAKGLPAIYREGMLICAEPKDFMAIRSI